MYFKSDAVTFLDWHFSWWIYPNCWCKNLRIWKFCRKFKFNNWRRALGL